MNSYGIVVFSKNSGNLIIKTLSRIGHAIEIGGLEKVHVVVVDDGSEKKIMRGELLTNLGIKEDELNFDLSIARCENSQGLGNAFKIGCEQLFDLNNNPFMLVTQLPANDQVQAQSIVNLLIYASTTSILSSWRENISTRPVAKRIASSFMHFWVHSLIFPQVKECTSNYTVPLWLALKYVPQNSRHAFGLWLLLGAYRESFALQQKPIQLVSDYGRRRRGLDIRKWHRVSDMYYFAINSIQIFTKLRRVYFRTLK